MKTEEIRIIVQSYPSAGELPEESRMLIERAKEASAGSWSPYSKFSVGAAILLENGEVITGNNQENSAFPSGLCAERVALFYAGARFPGIPARKIAIVAAQQGTFIPEPVFPCGGCRQALLELETRVGRPMEIIMFGEKEIKVVKRAADLLPMPFTLSVERNR